MKPIDLESIQKVISNFANQDLYLHLETTNGAYAKHKGETAMNVGAFVRNSTIRYSEGKILGDKSYRVGLKLEHGWVYAEGLTHGEVDDQNRLLLAGHNEDGKLMVAFELSPTPFS